MSIIHGKIYPKRTRLYVDCIQISISNCSAFRNMDRKQVVCEAHNGRAPNKLAGDDKATAHTPKSFYFRRLNGGTCSIQISTINKPLCVVMTECTHVTRIPTQKDLQSR